MYKILCVVAFLVFAKAEAQLTWGTEEYGFVEGFVDPGGTIDTKAFNGGVAVGLQSYWGYLRLSSEHAPGLTGGYRDVMFSPGITLQTGKVKYTAGPRFGLAWREVEGRWLHRENFGFEGALLLELSPGWGIGLRSSPTYRTDPELFLWDAKWVWHNQIVVRKRF